MELPKQVEHIITTLNEAGYEAYAVGGCVRDSVLHVTPKDWDITSNATPQEVKELFARTIDTGIQHGTVTVMEQKVGYEVTTYRIDGEYEDGRHPKQVVYTASLLEDLKRRDFTINAMAYHPTQGLVDAFGGIQDLKDHLIRCVGAATERFAEDALRMLRAVRFSAQLNFEIEEETLTGIKTMAPNIQKVSVERIYTELYKTLLSPHPEKLKAAYTTGLLSFILPEVIEGLSQCEEVFTKIAQAPDNVYVRLVILFTEGLQDTAEQKQHQVKQILRRLKTDLETIKTVSKLVGMADKTVDATPVAVRQMLREIGSEMFCVWISVKKVLTKEDDYETSRYQRIEELFHEILDRGDCYCIKDLCIDGKQLLALGVPQGKQVGLILDHLLTEVIHDPKKNRYDVLKAMVISEIE